MELNDDVKVLWTDVHTHRRYRSEEVAFIRNAYLPERNGSLTHTYPVSHGLHPWFIKDDWKSQLDVLENELSRNDVYAIGECGLDYLRGPEKSVQMEVLSHHLMLGQKTGLPVILHMVRSLHDLVPLLRRYSASVIIHDHSGNAEETKKLLDHNVYFSLGHRYLKNRESMKDTAVLVPVNRLFTETDVHRHSVREVTGVISMHKDLSVDRVRSDIYSNFVRLFKKYSKGK